MMIISAIALALIASAAFRRTLRAAATNPASNPRTATTAAVAQATVKIGNFQFTPKLLTVTPGTTVEWVNEAGRHTVEADDGSFKSDVLKQGDKFQHKFDKAGTYAYHCEFHGEKGGKDMAGKIVVRGK
jgi:plastocyanin